MEFPCNHMHLLLFWWDRPIKWQLEVPAYYRLWIFCWFHLGLSWRRICLWYQFNLHLLLWNERRSCLAYLEPHRLSEKECCRILLISNRGRVWPQLLFWLLTLRRIIHWLLDNSGTQSYLFLKDRVSSESTFIRGYWVWCPLFWSKREIQGKWWLQYFQDRLLWNFFSVEHWWPCYQVQPFP